MSSSLTQGYVFEPNNPLALITRPSSRLDLLMNVGSPYLTLKAWLLYLEKG